LLTNPPVNADNYRFDSVAIKEPKFEIDGVFLPPDTTDGGVVYFSEVQFQKDEMLYERLFAESLLYFYRNRIRYSDWQAVVIYPSRSIEQSNSYPYRAFLNSEQLYRVYLDELGAIRELPLGLALMVLTTIEEDEAPEEARYLLSRTYQEVPKVSSRAIIELVTTIMVYKFEQLSKAEVEVMLGITLQQTRVYREIKEEGRQEGEQEATVKLIVRLLTKRLEQELSKEMQATISHLPLTVLENLSVALLDFSSLADLQAWLDAH
jgi:predicted transposase/invertase (TIGR01784 family)